MPIQSTGLGRLAQQFNAGYEEAKESFDKGKKIKLKLISRTDQSESLTIQISEEFFGTKDFFKLIKNLNPELGGKKVIYSSKEVRGCSKFARNLLKIAKEQEEERYRGFFGGVRRVFSWLQNLIVYQEIGTSVGIARKIARKIFNRLSESVQSAEEVAKEFKKEGDWGLAKEADQLYLVWRGSKNVKKVKLERDEQNKTGLFYVKTNEKCRNSNSVRVVVNTGLPYLPGFMVSGTGDKELPKNLEVSDFDGLVRKVVEIEKEQSEESKWTDVLDAEICLSF